MRSLPFFAKVSLQYEIAPRAFSLLLVPEIAGKYGVARDLDRTSVAVCALGSAHSTLVLVAYAHRGTDTVEPGVQRDAGCARQHGLSVATVVLQRPEVEGRIAR